MIFQALLFIPLTLAAATTEIPTETALPDVSDTPAAALPLSTQAPDEISNEPEMESHVLPLMPEMAPVLPVLSEMTNTTAHLPAAPQIDAHLPSPAPMPAEDDQIPRHEKSLLNTFPFNTQLDAHDHHHHDHDHQALHGDDHVHSEHAAHTDLQVASNRQGYQPPPAQSSSVGLGSVASAQPNTDGKRCVDKVEMVDETEYDDVMTCDHSYDRRCHTSYTTTYEAQQEEECDENYRKSCYIAYEKTAFNETVKICRRPLVKDCQVAGEPVCRTAYESECWTKQEEHNVEDDVVDCKVVQDEKCEDETVGYTTQKKCQKWPRNECKVVKKAVKKYSPVTGCTKEPREICAPVGCGFKEGAEECYDKVQTIVQDKPTEECTIEPQRTCRHVTKLVPKLTPTEECVDVPKEICTRSRTNARKVKKPVIKKWCYLPSKESGLA